LMVLIAAEMLQQPRPGKFVWRIPERIVPMLAAAH
jgi:hypothetical protein